MKLLEMRRVALPQGLSSPHLQRLRLQQAEQREPVLAIARWSSRLGDRA